MKHNENMFLSLSVKHGKWLLLCLAAAFLFNGILIRGNAMIASVVDTVLVGESIVFKALIIRLLGMALLGGIFAFLCSFSQSNFAAELQNDFKNVAAAKVIKLEYRYFDKEGSGSVLNKFVSDINEVGRLLSETLPECLINMITFITITLYMFSMDVKLTLVVLFTYPIMLTVSNYVSKKLMALAKTRKAQLDERTEIAFDGINGVAIGRSYNLLEPISKRLFVVIDQIFKNEERRTRLSSASYVLNGVISWLPTIGCYVFALLEVIEGAITVGEMLVFVALLEKVTRAIGEFPFYLNDFREMSVSIKRLKEICMQPDEASGELEISESSTDCDSIISFNEVAFSYDEERYIFESLTFDVHKGNTVAFVGGSGQGKSTIFRILCGFYHPQKGIYKLYGKDFKEWKIESVRKEIALVSQNAFLFPESIEKNISYGRPDATREEVITACKMANIHDFIIGLPEGYDTIVGERGSRVSGGERQRIAIARAFLKNAPILLLDEPTSAVDVKTEEMIQEAIERISKDRTVLIIAHRLSTIQKADEILVLEQGRLVECGRHEELLMKNGIYATLYGKECKEGRNEDEQYA